MAAHAINSGDYTDTLENFAEAERRPSGQRRLGDKNMKRSDKDSAAMVGSLRLLMSISLSVIRQPTAFLRRA
jgi:hypothetical protein